MQLLLALYLAFSPISALEVALMPSTGCYSHDVMMKEVGMSMSPETNTTWIQTFLYDFGFGEMPLPDGWTRLSIRGTDEEGLEVMRTAGSLLWEQNVPTDFDRPWDLRGSFLFFKMLERHQTFCEKMLDDHRFLQYMRSQKADVVLLDHFLQECMGGLAYLLNASVVQFSNWPIADGYITSLNVPANPSAVPKTDCTAVHQFSPNDTSTQRHVMEQCATLLPRLIRFELSSCGWLHVHPNIDAVLQWTPYSGLGMSFFQRVGNLLFHWVIIAARCIQSYVLRAMFARKGFMVDVITSEAERTIYAGRSEFLFDVVRPINNRVKHFGSSSQINPSDFVTLIPAKEEKNTTIISSGESGHASWRHNEGANRTRSSSVSTLDCGCKNESTISTKSTVYPEPLRRAYLYKGLDQRIVKERFTATSMQYPELDWRTLTKEKFILVSFGSVAQAQHMPIEFVREIFYAFSRTPFKVIWQTNSVFESLYWRRNVTVPKNVVMINWAPVKHILAHPNLQYLICHGGINTINELLLFGVPVIGIYLQGDQGSNLRRLADLGAAVVTSAAKISQGKLLNVMRNFEENLEMHWQRATQLSSMLRTYRTLHKEQQSFWINWTARHGKSLLRRNVLNMRYVGDTENVFWLSIAVPLTALFLLLLC